MDVSLRYCFRKRQALKANSATEKTSRASKFGHSALHGAFFNVTPRTIVTMYRNRSA
jgi:hypothetical protein